MAILDIKNKSDLDYQVKILELMESLQAVHRWLLVCLAVVVVSAIPLFYVLRGVFFNMVYVERNLGVAPAPQGQDITVREKRILANGEDAYFAYARIVNPNSDLAVKNLTYTFVMKNASGEKVADYDGVTYIMPGEEKLIYMPARKFDVPPDDVEVSLKVERWSRPGLLRTLNFEVEGVQYGKQSDGGYHVSALLRNATPYIIPEVELTVILYNFSREVISVNFTTLNDLQLYESRFFSVQWPAGVAEKVANVEVRPTVNQLKTGALVTPAAGPDTRIPVE
jgi:hypothetical protein